MIKADGARVTFDGSGKKLLVEYALITAKLMESMMDKGISADTAALTLYHAHLAGCEAVTECKAEEEGEHGL